jgi:hypothetical protein
MQSDFSWIDELVRTGSIDPAFAQLVERLRQEKQYRRIFDARLMHARLQLGLPLVSQPTLADLPQDKQRAYQDAHVRAAREVGELFLADGDVAAAWPYFRAVGDTGPIAAALERYDLADADTPDAQDRLGAAIQIAFQERVHPRKGFELILKHYGLCRAITMFAAYPTGEGRGDSLSLLVRSLHAELVKNLAYAIADVEGTRPESHSVTALIEGREWLFENNAQYTDSSHIAPVLTFSAELADKETLKLAVEIADYATRLDAMFQYSDNPPFERAYYDRLIYLKALLGEDVDHAVMHFGEKAAASDADRDGYRPAEVLVELLTRLGRYDDAINAFRRYLMDATPEDLACPSLPQLCQMAGDFGQLKQVAKQESDPLSYMAALIQGGRSKG